MDNRSNTLARYNLLKKALQGSKQLPLALQNSCKSQGGLAKMDLPGEGISPMALNTLKAKANEVIEDGGWERLDEMRRSYLLAKQGLLTKSATTRSAATKLKNRLEAAEEALEAERRYRIRLQVAYEALLAKMKSSGERDPELVNFINRHVTGFSFKLMSLASAKDTGENE